MLVMRPAASTVNSDTPLLMVMSLPASASRLRQRACEQGGRVGG
jgi:hypothetical protein